MMQIKYAIWLLLLCASTSVVSAEAAGPQSVGGRAQAMGGAYTAVAADVSAVHWNPAGLASLQRQEIGLSRSDRYGLGLDQTYFGYSLPLGDNQAMGLDWLHLGFDDSELGLGVSKINFAYGYRNGIAALKPFLGNTAIGLSGKYRSYNVDLDGENLTSASGWGIDLGLLVPLPRKIRFGLTVHDYRGTSISHGSGVSEKAFSSRYSYGLAGRPLEGLTLTTQVDDAWRFGAEYWLSGLFALRGGAATERQSPESFSDATTLTFGFGLKYRFATFDYAYEHHPLLSSSHNTTLLLAYNPRVVSIKDATIRPNPVFRSLYKHYEENDFLDVVISNSATEDIRASVSLLIPNAMTTAHQETFVLPAQSKKKYTLKCTFDQVLFNQPEAYFDNFVTPVVQVTYTLNRKEQSTEKKLERIYLAGKGKLSWNVPGMAAAYVTPADLTVASMARGIIQQKMELLSSKFNRSNIGKAIVLFDALGGYRIRYQADQKTPFASVSDDKTVFDTVQYPSELLEKGEGVETKVGDCDDLTVLFASLLENLGIDTAFLEANDPGYGHIYMMFDSGISPEKAEDYFLSANEYVKWQGRIWIPLETTMYGFTFADAWRNGAAEYHRLKPKKLIDEVYVQKWLQTYKPASVPSVQITLPSNATFDSLLARDLNTFDQRIDQIALGSATSLDTPDGAYDAGAAYLRINHLEKAANMFDKVLVMQPDHMDAINAKAVVLANQGKNDEALVLFRKALEIRDEIGIRMNVALTYYLKGEQETADKLFEEVAARDPSYLELFDFLATVGDAAESYDIGVNYLRQKRFDLALAQFDEALSVDAGYVDAINAKGVVFTHQGKLDEALAQFEQAAATDPKQGGFRLNLSLVYHLKGDVKRAESIYAQLIAEDPAYEGLLDLVADIGAADEHYEVAVSYMQVDEFDRALDRLDKALEADPDMGDAHNARAVVLAHKGRLDDAYTHLEKAAKLLDQHPGVLLNMAIIRYKQGRLDDAKSIYRGVIEKDSRYKGHVGALEDLSGGIRKSDASPVIPGGGSDDGVLDFIADSVAVETADVKKPPIRQANEGLLDFIADIGAADEHYEVAVSYMQQEEFDRAMQRIDEALKADPEMGHAHNAKAVVLAHKGRLDDAFRHLETAIDLLDNHPGVVLNMAIIRYQQGKLDEARSIYAGVVERDARYKGYISALE